MNHSSGKLTEVKKITIILVILTLLGLAALIYPRGLALYHQSVAGRLIKEITASLPRSAASPFSCDIFSSLNNNQQTLLAQTFEHLQSAIDYNLTDSYTNLLFGRAYCLNGETEKAIKEFQKYVRSHPNNPLGRIELGTAFDQAGKERAAVEAWRSVGLNAQDFIEASGINNSFFPLTYERVTQLNDYRRALRWMHRAFILEPDNPYVIRQIGRICQAFFFEKSGLCPQILEKQGGNWIVDSNFEDLSMWFAWELTPETKYEFGSCPDIADKRCATIKIEGTPPQNGVGLYQCIKLNKGDKYRFSAWIKVETSPDGRWCPLCFEYRTDMQILTGPTDWQLWEYEFVSDLAPNGLNCIFPAILFSDGQVLVHSPRLEQIID